MENEIMDVATLAEDITLLIMPFLGVLVMVVITLWFKDFAMKIAKGMSFQMNKQFQEGDKVILDGESALIVKIGITETVFGVTKSSGEFDGDYVWRYVPNERIAFLKLEKVIFDHTPMNNRNDIAENSNKINQLKNGG
jgi:hypothetical protein